MKKIITYAFAATMFATPFSAQPFAVYAQELIEENIVKPSYYTAESTIKNYVGRLAQVIWDSPDFSYEEFEQLYKDQDYTIEVINNNAEVKKIAEQMNQLDEELAPLNKDSSDAWDKYNKLSNKLTVQSADWEVEFEKLNSEVSSANNAAWAEAQEAQNKYDDAFSAYQAAWNESNEAQSVLYGIEDQIDYLKSDLYYAETEEEKAAIQAKINDLEIQKTEQQTKVSELEAILSEKQSACDKADIEKWEALNNFNAISSIYRDLSFIKSLDANSFEESASDLGNRASALYVSWQVHKPLYDEVQAAFNKYMELCDKRKLPEAKLNLLQDELNDYLVENYPELLSDDNKKPGTTDEDKKPETSDEDKESGTTDEDKESGTTDEDKKPASSAKPGSAANNSSNRTGSVSTAAVVNGALYSGGLMASIAGAFALKKFRKK